MSETQFYVLITTIVAGLAGVATAIRWSVGLISKTIAANTLAMIDNTKSNAILATKVDHITEWVQRRATGQYPPASKKGRAPTNPFGNLVPLNKPDETDE